MKKIISLIIITIMLSTIFAACHNQNTESSAPVTKTDPLAEQKSALHDKVIKGSYTSAGDPQAIGMDWARMWLNDIYSDYGVVDAGIEYISSASYDSFSDSLQIYPMLYSIQFSSQKQIPEAQMDQNGTNNLRLFVIAVLENDKFVLSGFLGPGEFNENDAVHEIYNVVSNDPRYSIKLKPFPTVSLPREFTRINMSLITGENYLADIVVMTDEILAAICSCQVDDTGVPDLSVALFDLRDKKTFKHVDIGKSFLISASMDQYQKKLVIRTQERDSEGSAVFYIDTKGNMAFEKSSYPDKNTLFSPDGSRYAYSDKGSLYVVDASKNNNSFVPKLLIEGNPSDYEDGTMCYPFYWTDNSTLVYGIMGYEWSNGCGIVDTTTGQNTFFEQADRLTQPYALLNGKLYTITGAAGTPFDPGVIDMNDKKYPYRKVFKDRDFIENLNAEGYAFSPDGTKVALLKMAGSPGEKNILYICSTDDGSILKSFEFQTSINRPQQIDFLDNERIAVYPERYAFSAGDMYIVNTLQ